jgi:hypothetical protein
MPREPENHVYAKHIGAVRSHKAMSLATSLLPGVRHLDIDRVHAIRRDVLAGNSDSQARWADMFQIKPSHQVYGDDVVLGTTVQQCGRLVKRPWPPIAQRLTVDHWPHAEIVLDGRHELVVGLWWRGWRPLVAEAAVVEDHEQLRLGCLSRVVDAMVVQNSP